MSENIDFNEITKDDILKAFKKYDELTKNNELPLKRKQKDYILFYNSKEYPHKYIVGIAYGLKHNKEPLNNDLYSSTGKYKRSAQQCIEKNGFELYSDTKYKKYLESKYSNKITIGTYYSDLKKAIKIFQNIPEFKNKSLSDIFEAMKNDSVSFDKYDTSQKKLGYDDKKLFKTLKTKAKMYQEALQWEEQKFTNAEVTLYKQIAEKYSLRLHVSSGLKYVQIYPKATPKNEGVNGCHYEYYIKDNAIYFTLHLENKTYKKDELKANIVKVFEKEKIAIIHIDNNFSNERIIEEFDKLYNKVEKIITMHYKANIGEQYMQPLNQILYGPPGTGKTYNTINKALEIIFEKEDKNKIFEIVGKTSEYETTYTKAIEENNRESLKEIFNYYKEKYQIEFITFHQSYGYEEFVEGIKADLQSTEIKYKLEKGIFQKLCNNAKRKINNKDIFNNLDDGLRIPLLIEKDKELVIANQKEKYIYIKNPSGNDHTCNKENILDFYEKKDFNPTDKKSYEPAIAKYLYENTKHNVHKEQNYILIIDEINRGNISKIFGELITLIEPSKRISEGEEIQVKLPNSGELFGVPNNLYIIGTMNTADRSIAQIDTALRRRFEFIEMMPKDDLLQAIKIDGIEVNKVLEAMNERIKYLYDREHTIGHSYFMSLIDNPSKDKLDEIFRVNIIPLLAEYFYSDWEDIKIILNDMEDNGAFITKKSVPKYSIDSSKMNNKVYEVNKSFGDITSYQKIYAERENSN